MSYCNVPEQKKLTELYSSIIQKSTPNRSDVLSEGNSIWTNVKAAFGNQDAQNELSLKEVINYFTNKLKTDLKFKGQTDPSLIDSDFLKGWLVKNLLIITQSNYNNIPNPEHLNNFNTIETQLAVAPLPPGTPFNIKVYKDPWIEAALKGWQFANTPPKNSLSINSLDQILSVAVSAITSLNHSIPYAIKKGDSAGWTTLGAAYDRAYDNKSSSSAGSRLISLLPGSDKKITSSASSGSSTQGSSPQIPTTLQTNIVINAITQASGGTPPSSTVPSMLLDELTTLMSSNPTACKHILQIIFPDVK